MCKSEDDENAVAGRTEILQFLTGLLRGEVAENEKTVKERLKAAELLGKGCGAFAAEAEEAPEFKVEIEIVGAEPQQLELWPIEQEEGGNHGKQMVEDAGK